MDRADSLEVGEGPFTIAGWFRTDDQRPQAFMWAYDQAPHPRVPVSYVSIRIEPDNNRIQTILMSGHDDATTTVLRAPGSHTDGQWHHLAFTRDEEAVTLYVDGTQTATTDPHVGSISRNAFTGLHIGQRPDGGDQLLGAVDEIVLLDHALSAQEVSSLAESNVLPGEGAQLHLPLDQVAAPGASGDPVEVAQALTDVLEGYLDAGEIDGPIAHQSSNALDQAQRHLADGRMTPASQALERFIRHLDNPKRPDTLTETAAADLRESAEQIIEML
ncbi:LamG domain-containing protein [Pseudactinotalea sp. Z1748]|uniref:LamG domain-containing protein n=1 Tax=Pseudactinotalea sp. Z1748 TaxID=3413027 RepID=UPI003C7D73F0